MDQFLTFRREPELAATPLKARAEMRITRRLETMNARLKDREYLCDELCRTFSLQSATIWIAAPPMGQLMSLAASGITVEDSEQTVLLAPDDAGLREAIETALSRSG